MANAGNLAADLGDLAGISGLVEQDVAVHVLQELDVALHTVARIDGEPNASSAYNPEQRHECGSGVAAEHRAVKARRELQGIQPSGDLAGERTRLSIGHGRGVAPVVKKARGVRVAGDASIEIVEKIHCVASLFRSISVVSPSLTIRTPSAPTGKQKSCAVRYVEQAVHLVPIDVN